MLTAHPCRELLLPCILSEGSPRIHSACLTAWMRSSGSTCRHGQAGQCVAPGDGSPCPCAVWKVMLVAGILACHCLCWGLGVSMVHTALAALLQEPQAAVTPHRSPCGVDVLQVWVGQ